MRWLRRAAGAALVVLLFGGLSQGAQATSTKGQLAQAKARLAVLESQIAAEQKQLEAQHAKVQILQGQLNALAAVINVAQGRFDQIQTEIMDTRQRLDDARARFHGLQRRLDARARYAYENGTAGELNFILGATSLNDLSDRVEFMGQLSQVDSDLANAVQNRANALNSQRRNLNALLGQQASVIAGLNLQQSALDGKFAEQQNLLNGQQRLVDDLHSKQSELSGLIDKLKNKLHQEELARAKRLANLQGLPTGPGPFRYCPVQGPHAFSDSFGAPRYAGGYHPHAGNDILANRGTPIVAPFDGVASEDANGLGGNAVIVRGALGWVYNAHLDRYGTLGNVRAGTVIGYVGNTGDAAGGPTHDHFEWHPNVIPAHPYRSAYGYTVIDGSAIDPYPYLLQVC